MAEQSYSYSTALVSTSTIDVSGANTAVTPIVGTSFRATQLRVMCGTALGGTQGLITVTKRVIPGSDTSAVTVCTFTLLNTYIAGDVIEIDISSSANCELNPGESLKFAAAGSGTGTIYVAVYGYPYNAAPSPQNSSMPSTAKSPTAGVGTYKRLAATIS